MNDLSGNELLVVFDNKSGTFRVVNLLEKTISFSSFNNKCDAESLADDMKSLLAERRLKERNNTYDR